MTLAIHCPPAQTNSRWSMQTYHRSSRPHEASIPQSTPALKQLLRVGGWVDLSTQQISNLLEIARSESTTSEWQVRQSTTESHLTTRPLDYWTTRPLDHWTTGSLDHWTTGSLDYWTTRPLNHWKGPRLRVAELSGATTTICIMHADGCWSNVPRWRHLQSDQSVASRHVIHLITDTSTTN